MTVDRWDQRQLCADGGCIGVIGPEGTCKVCGRAAPNWGDERKRGMVEPAEEDEAEGDDDDEDDDEDFDPEDSEGEDDDDDDDDDDEDSAPGEWATRRVCSDGAC